MKAQWNKTTHSFCLSHFSQSLNLYVYVLANLNTHMADLQRSAMPDIYGICGSVRRQLSTTK